MNMYITIREMGRKNVLVLAILHESARHAQFACALDRGIDPNHSASCDAFERIINQKALPSGDNLLLRHQEDVTCQGVRAYQAYVALRCDR